jgi:galactose mutarotase-like enzyme
MTRPSGNGPRELGLDDGGARAAVSPERGGLVTRFTVGGRELLFLDRATFEDPAKNVRGGIPVLFPFAGKPPPGSPLKQHGFARMLPWTVESHSRAQLICALEANAATRASFPHDFRLALTVTLHAPRLSLAFTVTNQGDGPMPLHFGLHPYFLVPLAQKAAVGVTTSATRAFDNRTGQTGPLPARLDFGGADNASFRTFFAESPSEVISLGLESQIGRSKDFFVVAEVDLHLLDHAEPRTALTGHAALEWSPSFRTLVLWTLPGQPFVCVEPWSAPAGTLGGQTLGPGATATFDFSIRPLG